MEPEVRLLRYFLAVAEELNFTRAAEKLHIAQPSLSAQIRRLEAQLGGPLLRRSTRAVTLTEAGRQLLARGPGALAAMEQAWQAAHDATRGVVGALRLAYPLSAGYDTVPALLQAMQEEYPGISVTTDVLPTAQALAAVRDGRADVGIVRAASQTPGVCLEPLRQDPVGVLVSAGHALAAHAALELADVARYPVLVHPRDANPSHRDLIAGLFASRGLQPTYRERDIAFDLSRRFVADGGAISLVGRSATVGLATDLCWIPLAEPVAVTVALAIPAGGTAATTSRFRQFARAYAAAHGWLPGTG
jgi:DNA-binding transcriptional LysR family regulator